MVTGGGHADIVSTHIKNREFMKRYANLVDTSIGGYNPMLQDYENTSFFIAERN